MPRFEPMPAVIASYAKWSPFQVLLWRNLATVVVELGSGRMPGILSHRSEHESFHLINKYAHHLLYLPLKEIEEYW